MVCPAIISGNNADGCTPPTPDTENPPAWIKVPENFTFADKAAYAGYTLEQWAAGVFPPGSEYMRWKVIDAIGNACAGQDPQQTPSAPPDDEPRTVHWAMSDAKRAKMLVKDLPPGSLPW